MCFYEELFEFHCEISHKYSQIVKVQSDPDHCIIFWFIDVFLLEHLNFGWGWMCLLFQPYSASDVLIDVLNTHNKKKILCFRVRVRDESFHLTLILFFDFYCIDLIIYRLFLFFIFLNLSLVIFFCSKFRSNLSLDVLIKKFLIKKRVRRSLTLSTKIFSWAQHRTEEIDLPSLEFKQDWKLILIISGDCNNNFSDLQDSWTCFQLPLYHFHYHGKWLLSVSQKRSRYGYHMNNDYNYMIK